MATCQPASLTHSLTDNDVDVEHDDDVCDLHANVPCPALLCLVLFLAQPILDSTLLWKLNFVPSLARAACQRAVSVSDDVRVLAVAATSTAMSCAW